MNPEEILDEIRNANSKSEAPDLTPKERDAILNHIRDKTYPEELEGVVEDPLEKFTDENGNDIDQNKHSYERELIVKIFSSKGEDLSVEQAAEYLLGIGVSSFKTMRQYYAVYKHDSKYLERV